jgi:hypothetical protein
MGCVYCYAWTTAIYDGNRKQLLHTWVYTTKATARKLKQPVIRRAIVGKHGHGQRGVNRAQEEGEEEKGGAAAVVVTPDVTVLKRLLPSRPPTARLLASCASKHLMH